MLICTLVSGSMDGCMYVNMYIGIWWYGRLYECYYDTLVSGGMDVVCMLICTLVSGSMDSCMYVNMYIGI
jgi:hypothetical protein